MGTFCRYVIRARVLLFCDFKLLFSSLLFYGFLSANNTMVNFEDQLNKNNRLVFTLTRFAFEYLFLFGVIKKVLLYTYNKTKLY